MTNHILTGTRFYGAKARLLRRAGWEIGAGTKIVGPVFCTGQVRLGEKCWVGRNFTVHGNGTLTVGDCCDIAPDVTILTGGHRIGGRERRAGEGRNDPVCVGAGTWVGARATILGNVSIGRGCVIGACACVCKDIPDDSLAAGVPACVKRNLNE